MVCILILFLLVGFLEIFYLYKQKQKKELALYSVMIIAALTISLLLSYGVKIPSPAKPIKQIITTIIGE